MTLEITAKTLLIGLPIVLLVLLGSWVGVETYTATSSFCGGICHTMTEQYVAWKVDTHHAKNNKAGAQAECIDCHFLPGEHGSLKAKYEGLRHLAAYLYDRNAPLPIRPDIPDGACLSSGCHSDKKFEDKELQFADKIKFKHTVHLGEKALDGHKLTCDTCHFKVTESKHFEVPKDICYLCHLKLEKPTLEKAVLAQDASSSNGSELQSKIPTGGATIPVSVDGKTGFGISFKNKPSIDFNSRASRDAAFVTLYRRNRSRLSSPRVIPSRNPLPTRALRRRASLAKAAISKLSADRVKSRPAMSSPTDV